jgi:hypothetical protein
MIGGTMYIANTTAKEARDGAASYFRDCMERPIPGYDCLAASENLYRSRTEQLAGGGLWEYAAGEAAIRLALTLLVLGIIFGAVRWIMAGRSRER